MNPQLYVERESWPIAGGFTIARGSKSEAELVVARLEADGQVGRGECVPYPRYGESVSGVSEAIAGMAEELAAGLDRQGLLSAMPAGAARNAIDAALWNLETARTGTPAWERAGLPTPKPVTTAFTISLGTPEKMAADSASAAARPLLKVKLGGEGDEERIRAVRAAAPRARLIVDANEAWDQHNIERRLRACAEVGVLLVEQPLAAAEDAVLAEIDSPVPLCADESFHGLEGLDQLATRYRYVNLKLDKTGGLTAALEVARAARERGLRLMVGCMVGTSLGMAPAFLLTPWADFVDLDGPLLLSKDREPGFHFEGSSMHPAPRELWA
ncbi:MAG: dipeptide epimerase [Planctomycetota bacterium]|nr:MAG: dipeptide epimerase [Planctomycetota bacterium]